jgi:cyclopropane fatty-acyl-phospholipid synthase-like methyltransferase
METIEAGLSELVFQAQTLRQTASQRRDQAIESGRQLTTQSNLRGADFQTTRHWLERLEAERTKAIKISEQLAQKHHSKLKELVEACRKVKLLETLRKRNQDSHQRKTEKQLEAQASEFYLAKRIREQH